MNAPTSPAPLTDQRLDEIQGLLPKVFAGPWRAETDPKGFGLIMDNALPVATVSYNLDELLPFLAAAPDLVKEPLTEVRDQRERIANARAEIAWQNDAGQGELGGGACDAVDAYLVDPQHRPARHRSPGYQGEIPDHHGTADTCAMHACVTARAQHEAAADIQDLTYELLAGREPKAGA